MAQNNQEIERWFLPKYKFLPPLNGGTRIRQGYLAEKPSIRIRLSEDEDGKKRADLTIKSARTGISRKEIIIPISVELAEELLPLSVLPLVLKTRYRIKLDGASHPWEIDVFRGDNQGLIKVEIELEREDEQIVLPDWIFTEVTYDDAYANKNLARHPFCSWPEHQKNLGKE